MKTYMCDNCGFINNIEDYNESSICSNCKATYDKLKLIESQIAGNEIDAIIDSVIDNLSEEKEEKIVNKDENIKSLIIDKENPCIKKNSEKCINCGQCKKTCEKNSNIRYDLNKCSRPICIGCGKCVKNCPSQSLSYKEDYPEVKEVIDKNEKIVVSIVEPNIPYLIANHYNLEDNNFELKLNDLLKKIGFDYNFNSGFACDLSAIEEVSEFIERLKNKKLLPLISNNCPSLTKYLEVYHKDTINNISTCKNPLFIQSELIKEFFCNEKGFNKEKIIIVGITTCISNKMKQKESTNSLDYVITIDELIKMIDIEEISMKNLIDIDYDGFSEFTNSSKLFSLCGGQSEIFIKTFCKLVDKTKNKVNQIDDNLFKKVNGIKELIVNISSYKLKIAIINNIYELDYLIDTGKYKKYHYIEIKMCENGCLIKNESSESLVDYIHNNVNKYPFDNKGVKPLYNTGLTKPLSQKAIELLHENYNDKSNYLAN